MAQTAQTLDRVDCTIEVRGNYARVRGIYPSKVVYEATSFLVPGYQFSPRYRRQRKNEDGTFTREWDGRERLRDEKGWFPSGLVPTVKRELQAAVGGPLNAIIKMDVERERPKWANNGYDLIGVKFGAGKYNYQLETAERCKRFTRGIVKLATGAGKTEVMSAVASDSGLPTLCLVPNNKTLLRQTQKRMAKRLGMQEYEVGVIGDGERRIGDFITVAMPTGLATLLEDPWMKQRVREHWKMVFIDEAHHAAAKTRYDVLEQLDSIAYRFGFSGTPLDRSDGQDLRLIAQTGDIIMEITNAELIERGVSVRPIVRLHKVAWPEIYFPDEGEIVRLGEEEKPFTKELRWRYVKERGVIENMALEVGVVEATRFHVAAERSTFVLVIELAHGARIVEALQKVGVDAILVCGDDPVEVREQRVAAFAKKPGSCLVATQIFGEGFDAPSIDAIVMADSTSSTIETLQRVGRGLRAREGKDVVYIEDFANFAHEWLVKHALMRLETYKDPTNGFVIDAVL
jgi:superfamily II DNA or RNA helicase